jgi:hypothetical protein
MSKKNIILTVILIIMAGAAWAYDGPYRDWQSNNSKPHNFLSGFDLSRVNKVEVAYNGKNTTMEKFGDQWRVAGFKDFYVADDVSRAMIEKLAAAQKADFELASGNQDKKSSFQTDTSGAQVKLSNGNDVLADFIVGRMVNDYNSSYLAQPDSPNTYLVGKVNLNSAFAHDDWLDRVIFKSDSAKISKLRFQISGSEFTVEKTGDKWAGTKPKSFPVDQAKVQEAANAIANLSAEQIPEQNFAGTGLEKNNLIIQAIGEGIDDTLMIGADNGDDLYYAKKGDSDKIYLIGKEQKMILSRKSNELK